MYVPQTAGYAERAQAIADSFEDDDARAYDTMREWAQVLAYADRRADSVMRLELALKYAR